ncbi:MAG: DNA repair protein RecO [Planctomycetia bacterium TMED53]|nr:MAG: DNA repair protein RecO [Planctomycetia bacterium TMED53]
MKGSFRTRGLVLRTTDYSETSQVIRVFAREHGVLDLLAKGARRPARNSSSFHAPFDPGSWYDISFRKKAGDLQLATEARLVEGFRHLRHDLPAWLDATLAMDLLRTLFTPGDPHDELLRETLQYFKLLSAGQGRRRLRNRYLHSILAASGLQPSWESCSGCEKPLPVSQESRLAFQLPSGFFCGNCSISGGSIFVDHALLNYLRADSGQEWGRVPTWEVPDEVVLKGWDILSSLVSHHLERPPRSLKYLRV